MQCLIADAINAVATAVRAVNDITRFDFKFLAIVIVHSLAGKDVVGFGLTMMLMISQGTTRFNDSVGRNRKL